MLSSFLLAPSQKWFLGPPFLYAWLTWEAGAPGVPIATARLSTPSSVALVGCQTPGGQHCSGVIQYFTDQFNQTSPDARGHFMYKQKRGWRLIHDDLSYGGGEPLWTQSTDAGDHIWFGRLRSEAGGFSPHSANGSSPISYWAQPCITSVWLALKSSTMSPHYLLALQLLASARWTLALKGLIGYCSFFSDHERPPYMGYYHYYNKNCYLALNSRGSLQSLVPSSHSHSQKYRNWWWGGIRTEYSQTEKYLFRENHCSWLPVTISFTTTLCSFHFSHIFLIFKHSTISMSGYLQGRIPCKMHTISTYLHCSSVILV